MYTNSGSVQTRSCCLSKHKYRPQNMQIFTNMPLAPNLKHRHEKVQKMQNKNFDSVQSRRGPWIGPKIKKRPQNK